MDDEHLRRMLVAAEYMVSPQSKWTGVPRDCFLIQLALIEQEMERRAIVDDSGHGFQRFNQAALMTMVRTAIQLLI